MVSDDLPETLLSRSALYKNSMVVLSQHRFTQTSLNRAHCLLGGSETPILSHENVLVFDVDDRKDGKPIILLSFDDVPGDFSPHMCFPQLGNLPNKKA